MKLMDEDQLVDQVDFQIVFENLMNASDGALTLVVVLKLNKVAVRFERLQLSFQLEDISAIDSIDN